MNVRKRGRLFLSRTFVCAVLANAVAGIGVPVYSYQHHPAWMWGYYVDPATVESRIVLAVFTAYWIPFLIGYCMPRWIEWRNPGSGWTAVLLGLLAQAGLIWWQWGRYSKVMSYAEFHSHQAGRPLAEIEELQYAGAVAIGVVLVLLFFARQPGPREHRA